MRSSPAAFAAVPNFATSAAGALGAGPRILHVHSDAAHNRTVVTLAAASGPNLLEALFGLVEHAVATLDLGAHRGLHPRVGVADVLPIVPLGGAGLGAAVDLAGALAERVWTELRVPVFMYGAAAAGRRLAEIRAGGLAPDLGGPLLHPTAGAACVGGRPLLVAYNLVWARVPPGIAVAMRALPGVQALTFPLPDGRVQLSLNLTRPLEAGVADVHAHACRLAGAEAEPELVGLCPARAAGPGCAGGLLEGRLAALAARQAGRRARERGGAEQALLARRLEAESVALAGLGWSQDELLAGAERTAALPRVLRAGGIGGGEPETLLAVAAAGLRAAVTPATARTFAERVRLLDGWRER